MALLPQHIAIVMDGNGRWAAARGLPRAAGHQEGVRVLRRIVEHCSALGIGTLTVFAFSSENWNRPDKEVSLLMELFVSSLREEVNDLHANNVHLSFIGDRGVFPQNLRAAIGESEEKTHANTGLNLVVAANYGGRWDIAHACARIAAASRAGEITARDVDEKCVGRHMSLCERPDPDLFIRTGGEQRISNFLLWQLAYTELYFTDVLWPEFTPAEFDRAAE